jgi:hypothetical protein
VSMITMDCKDMDDYGFNPCLPVADRSPHIQDLLNPKDIVIADEEIQIEYDYPLSRKVRFSHRRKGGWTRIALARAIRKDYARIYREEDEACGPTDYIPGMLNRDFSDGPYGIWGHDIDDLAIEGVTYYKKTGIVRLSIGS